MQSVKLPLLARAIARRTALRDGPEGGTDAIRIVDGRADGFDDLEIDDFAGHWLAGTRGDAPPHWLRESFSSQLPSLLGKHAPVSIYWKKLAAKKEPPQWIAGDKINVPFTVRESGVRYWIDFEAGYSQGLFLDQRVNRRDLRSRAAGRSVLNCFAYTCAFGLCAALGDAARTVNVDLSRRYLDWGKRNYTLNSLDPGAHEFLHGDVAGWLARFERKDRRFDIIVLDPPTFSRDDRGRIFTVESGFSALLRAALRILAPDGEILCSTNQRSLTLDAFKKLIACGLDKPFSWRIDPMEMPPEFPNEPYLKSCWVLRRA